jgi:hypothetical protein
VRQTWNNFSNSIRAFLKINKNAFLCKKALESIQRSANSITQRVDAMVARWFIFKPKIPIWENVGGPGNGKFW